MFSEQERVNDKLQHQGVDITIAGEVSAGTKDGIID